MNIKHFITFNAGSGPISLVEIEDKMLRVTHRARFDRTKQVDADQARAMVKSLPDLGRASTKVPVEYAANLSLEVLAWLSKTCGDQRLPGALRWENDGTARHFPSEAEARQYDELNPEDETEIAPAKRRRVMMG